jgi:hypothetical protein
MKRRRVAAVVIGGISTSLLVASVALTGLSGVLDAPFMVIVIVSLLLVGTALTTRRPDNAVAWLVLLAAFAWTALAFTESYARYGIATHPGALPGTTVALWFATWLWIPGLVLLPVFVLLLFPDGRPPSPRWRPVLWAAGLGLGLAVVAQGTTRWGADAYHYDFALHAVNPLHLPAVERIRLAAMIAGVVLLLVALVGAITASILRFRRSSGQIRQQMKWMVVGGISTMGLYAVAVAVAIGYEALVGEPLPYRFEDVLVAAALSAFPVSIAVAVLRYRLYDIDRIVSRTLGYRLLPGVSVGVYGGGLLGALFNN